MIEYFSIVHSWEVWLLFGLYSLNILWRNK